MTPKSDVINIADNQQSTSQEVLVEGIHSVDVTRIHHYERNPRRQRNPEYDRIKASIQREGLDQPLVITSKPGSNDYLLQAGGNTRLLILKELYEATGEKRFHWVSCLFKPWVHESNVLLAHLRENELRGSLHFIDKAQAVLEAKQLLEKELNIDELSQRRLEELFKERGFSLSHSMISQMSYAVHTLLPLIPVALSAGLGRPKVEQIRALERTARQIWKRRELGNEAIFDDVFAALCRRYDGPEWDNQSLRAALENEIAEETELSLQGIRMEFDACLSGRDITVNDSDHSDINPETTSGFISKEAGNDANHQILAPIKNEDAPNEVASTEKLGSLSPQQKEPRQSSSHANVKPAVETEQSPSESILDPLPDNIANNIQSLRTRVCTLAASLAERNGLADLVKPLPGQGLGFVLRDVPDPALTETLDQAMLGQVSTLWWQLAACSEITVAPLDILIRHLEEGVILRQALEEQDATLLFNSVWTLDPGHAGHQLWQQLSDQDWQDLLQLMDAYRQLKRLATDTGTPLWSGV